VERFDSEADPSGGGLRCQFGQGVGDNPATLGEPQGGIGTADEDDQRQVELVRLVNAATVVLHRGGTRRLVRVGEESAPYEAHPGEARLGHPASDLAGVSSVHRVPPD
jgi:hypothetical protein